MGISLTLFLNLNCLMLILFPYGKMFAQKGVNKAESFSKSVCSTAFFIIVYFFCCIPTFVDSFFVFPTIRQIPWILGGSVLSLLIEFSIFIIKYKKLKIATIRSGKFFELSLLLVMIPILEEIIYVLCLHILCESLNIPTFLFIIMSSISFGLGHFIYPKINIVTKTIWGLVFSIIYVLTGCIYIVIISHIINNLFLYLLGKTQKFKGDLWKN